MKYARQCSVTKQGMNAGYVWSDGSYYCIDDDSIALTEFRKDRDNIVECIPIDLEEIEEYDSYYEGEHDDYIQAIQRSLKLKETDEDLRILSYLFDLHYYTEWDDENDFQYEMINGALNLIE
tara:strand:- start:294 stop:659 length:366 start_codon:yes stop_codon:yes gene_type:complete